MDKEAAKRQKLVCDQRQRRTEELVEDMKSATDTIKLLELQRGKFVTGEKYLQAAEVVSQITEWRGKQRKLFFCFELSLKNLTKKASPLHHP